MPVKKEKVTATKKSTNKKVEKVKEEIKKDAKDLEKKAADVEKKADKTVNELVKKVGFVDKIINASRVKEILGLSFIEKTNKRVRKNLELICKILGWFALIIGIIYLIIKIIALFIGFASLFIGAIRVFIVALISLLNAILTVIMGRGYIKMKKRMPALLTICILLNLILLVLNIFSGTDFGRFLLENILDIICILFVLKNKDMFKN